MGFGLPLNLNGRWDEAHLTPEMKDLIQKYPRNSQVLGWIASSSQGSKVDPGSISFLSWGPSSFPFQDSQDPYDDGGPEEDEDEADTTDQ